MSGPVFRAGFFRRSARLLGRPMTEIPGPKSFEEFATAVGIPNPLTRNHIKVHAMHKHHGDIYLMSEKVIGRNLVNVLHPADIEKVMRAEGKYPVGAATFLYFLQYYLQVNNHGVDLSSVTGEAWKQLRGAVQKHMFAPNDAASYCTVVDPAMRTAAHALAQNGDKIASILPFVTFDAINAVLFGRNLGTSCGKASEADTRYVYDVLGMFQCFLPLMNDPREISAFKANPQEWAANSPVYQRISNHMDYIFKRGRELLDDCVAEIEKNPDCPENSSYFAKKLRDGDLTIKDLVTNTLTFLLAGVDTTSAVLQWVFWHVANNPEQQERMRAEFIEATNGTGVLTPERWSQLTFFRAALKEVYRLTPAVQGTLRILPTEIEIRGYTIPPGTMISVSPLPYQTEPKIWGPDAEAFKPDRWLGKKAKNAEPAANADPYELTPEMQHNPYMLLIFGRGPRMCMGSRLAEVEMGSLFAHLLCNYRIEFAEDTPPGVPEMDSTGGIGRPTPEPKYKFVPLNQ